MNMDKPKEFNQVLSEFIDKLKWLMKVSFHAAGLGLQLKPNF